MGRKPCCAKEGLNRGAWTSHEDKILVSYIKQHGEGKWRNLPKKAGLKRCGKSCRLRWLNYLRPDIKRGNISEDEEDLIIRLHKLLGNRWSLIAGRLPGRTDNEIKNYWNTNLGKRVHGQSSQPATSKGKNPVIKPPMIDLSPPKATPDAQVIRTKAARCTRTFFSPDQHPLNLEPKGVEVPSVILPRNDSFNDMSVCERIQVGGHTMRQDGYSANMDVQLQDPAPFGGLTLEDWFSSECFEPDITVDFQSLASFLHSEDEWN